MSLDLVDLFRFNVSPVEIMVRGTVVYWMLFLLLRFILARDTGSMAIADILLLVLIADASQNAMAGSYDTVAEGALLVATIAAWNWLLDWGGYHFRLVRKLVDPPPVVLVRRGQIVHRSLRREFITVQELMARLREHGIDKLRDVKIARLESDGDISVIQDKKPSSDDTGGSGRRKPYQ